jgi:ribosomal protein L7Ae-like RNA K-turn-binding protein
LKNKVFSMLGIAAKSGNVVSGEFSTEKAVKSGKAWLVIISEEASENTIKKFSNMTDFYEVPLYRFGTKEELGHCIGKEFRASLAIVDENLAKAVETKIEQYAALGKTE